ncbi:MAG: PorT family protein [Bacteroidaceae bacterium]|nr:PorT family protein [Bacteroidaceae bacterium]
MKKILSLVAAVVLCATGAMAQVSVGVGYMQPNHISTDNTLNGFYAGVDYNINLSGDLSVAPGVFYSRSFGTRAGGTSLFNINGSATYTEDYVGVPLNFNYGLDLARDLRISVFAGPTFAYGLTSTAKYDASVAGISGSTTRDLYANENYKKMEVLVGGGFAFDYAHRFRVALGYNVGMMDRDATDNGTFKRNYLHMGFAFLF